MRRSKVTHTRYRRPVTMASVWHVIAGHLSVCPSACPSNQITHEALQQSHNFFKCLSLASRLHTHTHMNGSKVVCQLAWSHCTSNCDGFCDFTHRGGGVCVCVRKVNSRSLCCCADIKPIFQPEVSVKSVLLCESWRRGAGSPAAADATATS